MSILPASGIGDESTGFYNGAVEQSGRFFGTTGYIDHQFGTPTSTQKMILAFWVKPSEFGDKQNIFGGGASSTNYVSLSFSNSGFYNANDQLKLLVVNSNTDVIIKITNRLFRDPSAWMHVCVAIDTTQATAGNRVQLFFNGIRYTGGYASEHTPDENENLTQINSAMYHQIGLLYAGANYGHFDGYLADFYFLDGQSIYSDTSATINSTFLADADTLGVFCEQKNGVAIPKAYTGATSTYGNNGFRLEFKNNTAGGSSPSSSTFGADTSGKDNHFNDYGSNTTWQGGNADSPENNFCTLNPLGKQSASALSLGALRAVITSGTNSGRTPSTFAVTSGKWYWEVRQNSSNRFAMGVFDADRYVMANEDGGSDAYEWVFITSDNAGSGARRNSGSITNGYGGDTASGHVVMVALDVDNGAIYFGKQGSWFNNGTSDDSATVKSQIEAGTTTNAAYTSVTGRLTPCFVRQTSNNDLTVNFGQDDTFQTSSGAGETTAGNTDGNGFGKFQYEPPSGFLALCSSNLPDLTIGPDSSTQADDNFNTILYSGDGQSTNDITGVGFKPDWTWIKERSSDGSHIASHVILDSSRGYEKYLVMNATNADGTGVSNNNSTRSNDGFQVNNSGATNQSGQPYVAWNWLANGGTTSSNTDGDITSTVQVNSDAGFSIVLFTGDGNNGSTVGHGLGVKPAWYIVKDRDTNAYGHWMVYHTKVPNTGGTSRGNADNLFLNLTNGQNAQGFGATDPASTTTFKPAVTSYTNNSGNDYVAYVFAEVEGYSKFGIYTGNNDSDGTFVYTGFRPAWIMIKATAQTESWGIHDNKRNTFNVVDTQLLANVSNAENAVGTARQQLDFTGNGFKLRNAGDANPSINNESTTYVYMAFAEQPFKFCNGR